MPTEELQTPWADRPVDVDFLVDSGLLFQANHELFHPLGFALTVRRDASGAKSFGFRDARAEPGTMVFDAEAAARGREKMARFLAQYGRAQLARRKRALGREVQNVNPPD